MTVATKVTYGLSLEAVTPAAESHPVPSDAQSLKFQPRARIIRTIGDQLISGPEAAVIELVKNAYDADAERVTVKFYPPLQEGQGRISVTDDGHGMSLDDIRVKWMEPATFSKSRERRSRLKARRMMGSKGIGRFAAAKLGAKMSLLSTIAGTPKNQSILIPEIDWSIFSEDVYLSDVSISFMEQSTVAAPGTTIEILELNEAWTEPRVRKLHTELRRLLSPLVHNDADTTDFQIYLDLSECNPRNASFDGEAFVDVSLRGMHQTAERFLVLPFPLLKSCDYELEGRFDKGGRFSGTFQIRRAGRGPEAVELAIPLSDDERSPGAFDVHLFLFDREADAIKNNMKSAGMGELTAREARQLLDNISGISIYRDRFRIRPYGDPENDWLALDSRRVQDPSLKIGHNQVSGYISIEGPEESQLIERSSREGFEENAAFRRLTRLTKELLTKIVEPSRYRFRAESGLSRRRSTTFDEVRELAELKRVRRLLTNLAPAERERAELILDQESARLSDRIEQLQERQRVLEAKSSLGAIVGEILHEGGPAAAYVAKTSDRLVLLFPSLIGGISAAFEHAKGEYSKKLPHLKTAGATLETLFRNLRPLAGGKRGQPKFFYPGFVIRSAAELFDKHQTRVDVSTDTQMLELIGYPEDLSTAAVNLIGNSIYWLEDTGVAEPVINIKISRRGDLSSIVFQDNGPGVPAEFAEHIFDVGFSLKEGGTGLGLNIARETLARSGATLLFHAEHSPGAMFEILFPARRD